MIYKFLFEDIRTKHFISPEEACKWMKENQDTLINQIFSVYWGATSDENEFIGTAKLVKTEGSENINWDWISKGENDE